MSGETNDFFVCPVCGASKPSINGMPGELINGPVAELIKKTCPAWSKDGMTCLKCLNHFGVKYVQESLEAQKGELSVLEAEVLKSLEEQEFLSRNVNVEFDKNLTLGQRVADRVTAFGGSWTFIGLYMLVLTLWVGINSYHFFLQPFDPYPFIFLNLILSGLATFQAPIILMSQNRQDQKDRLRSEYDYRVNLKAELEIRHLNAKMNNLLSKQWARLLEIQQIQIELLNAATREPVRTEEQRVHS
ncbi:MAG TPA: DUF1003 domain-containing protein [Desulfomonilaceae bacterium]|nr:DUF1003 domain-containing protein [Desulfomonilaceae bacterium]